MRDKKTKRENEKEGLKREIDKLIEKGIKRKEKERISCKERRVGDKEEKKKKWKKYEER